MAAENLRGHNVSFVAVARLVDRTVVTWCSHGASVDLAGVRTVLDPAQMARVERKKHYNFTSAGNAWHVTSDGERWIFLAITATSYPIRHAAGLLEDLGKAFAPKEDKGLNVRLEGALNGDLQPKLSKLCARYDDLAQVDNLHATLSKVEAVKVVMQDSIELALNNCVSLESIDQKADELQNQAGMFKTRAKKLRTQMWWKKCKMQLLITFIVLAILACIIVPIVLYFKKKDKDDKDD